MCDVASTVTTTSAASLVGCRAMRLEVKATCCGCGAERDLPTTGKTMLHDTAVNVRVVQVDKPCPSCGDERVRLRVKIRS